MVPRGVTIGVNVRRTPYSRNWMETAGVPPDSAPADAREGKLAARQKAALFAILSEYVGLGEDLKKTFGLQGFDGRSEVQIGPEEEKIESVGDS